MALDNRFASPDMPAFFSNLDLRFGEFLEGLSGGADGSVFLGAALVSRSRRLGHTCVDLGAFAGQSLPAGKADPASCPPLNDWLTALRESPCCGAPNDYRPLVLIGSRLYLYRYWDAERRLAEALAARITSGDVTVDEALLAEGLVRMFPDDGTGRQDGPRRAAAAAVRRRFCIISGGPGTGKTYTVARILALLTEQARGRPFRVALAAPTGKAAARLQEAVREARTTLPCSEAVRTALPETASTLHRLLGIVARGKWLNRKDPVRRLAVDAVVIDEASMVDLVLFSRLLRALPDPAHLILLGDKDQLASVEAGAVLGDLCRLAEGLPPEVIPTAGVADGPVALGTCGWSAATDRAGDSSPVPEDRAVTGLPMPKTSNPTLAGIPSAGMGLLDDALVILSHSFRFDAGGEIQALSRAVNAGEGGQVLTLLLSPAYPGATWREIPPRAKLEQALATTILPLIEEVLTSTDPAEAFRRFNRFRLLCALREGPYGTLAVNALMERALIRRYPVLHQGPWYRGRPVLVTRNDYGLRLFNGDVGLALPDPDRDGDLRVFFPAEDGSYRSFPPRRLPEHETVYAMTVHKSQGSEFDEVLLLLPNADAPVLTRELLYTGITRARKAVRIWGDASVLRIAIDRQTLRTSGLQEAIGRIIRYPR